MLDYFRKHSRSKPVMILFGLIALTFVFGFGVLPSIQGSLGLDPTVMAEVNGVIIRYNDLQSTARRLADRYRAQTGQEIDDVLGDTIFAQALDVRVNGELLLIAADRAGIAISDEEVIESIRTDPTFERDGAFSRELYLRLLERQGIQPRAYEEQTRIDLSRQRLQQLLRVSIGVTDAEVEDRYRLENGRLELQYLSFDPAVVQAEVPEPTDEELTAHYEATRTDYQDPARVRAGVLTLSPEALAGEVELAESVIRARYERDPDRFRRQESVTASHILIEVDPAAESEFRDLARARAEAVLVELREGGDWDTLAAEHSGDPSNKDRGGSLGTFGRGQMVEAFEEAAFAAETGEIVGPVETRFGYHLIRVDEHLDARTLKLSEVREELEEELRLERARSLAPDRLRAIREASLATGLAGAAEGPIAYEEVGPVAADEPILGSRRITDTAFVLGTPGAIEGPIESATAFHLVELLESIPARDRPLDEARAMVVASWRTEQGRERAHERAVDALTRLRSGEGLQAVADAAGVELRSTGPFSPLGSVVPGLGGDPELVRQTLALSDQDPYPEQVFEVRDRFAVIAFQRRTHQAPEGFDEAEALDLVRRRLLFQKQTAAFEALIDRLRREEDVRIFMDNLAALSG